MATTYSEMAPRDEASSRALVSFRIVLPAEMTPQAVHLLGSWDNFRTAFAMEQDVRVGRGVWKYMVTDNGGLEMGGEYTYYFLLDSGSCIPDPGSSPELTTTDPRTGRLASILHVPLELPPSSTRPPPPPPHVYLQPKATPTHQEKVPSIIATGSSAFPGSVGRAYEEPRKAPEHPAHASTNSGAESPWNSGSLKGRIRASSVRRVSSVFLGTGNDISTEEVSVKRKWSLVKKTSSLFRSMNKNRSDDGVKTPQAGDHVEAGAGGSRRSRFQGESLSNKKVPVPSEPKHNVSDIVGYLRERSSSELVHDISHRSQPAKAYYHSPVTINAHTPPIMIPPPQMPRSTSDASKKSTGTTTSTDTSPSLSHSLASSCSCNDGSNYTECSPMAHSSAYSPAESCSSDGGDNEDGAYEVETPIDGLGITTSHHPSECVYPKYYNFDEISGVPGGNRDIGKYSGDVILNGMSYEGIPGSTKPLACLREEVAGELAWRDELVGELGYLSGVVI